MTDPIARALPNVSLLDQDEKALKFLLTVPQKWRLFWAIQSFGASFALALIAIYYIGDASPLLEGSYAILKTFPTWFVWSVNPAGVTLCSVALSSTLQVVCVSCSSAPENVDSSTPRVAVVRALVALSATLESAKRRVMEEPWFCGVMGCWLVQVVPTWVFMKSEDEYPVAFVFTSSIYSIADKHLIVSKNVWTLLTLNVVLVAGLAMKALAVSLKGNNRVMEVEGPRYSAQANGHSYKWDTYAGSRVPSLLVGWGIGYWATSLLYILGCSWRGGGWNTAPVVVSLLGYIIIPCFALAGVFIVSDADLFGTKFGAIVNPVVKRMRNKRGVEYWAMVTVYRDVLIVWLGYCGPLAYGDRMHSCPDC